MPAEKPNAAETEPVAAAPERKATALAAGVGFVVSLALLASTTWVIAQYLRHRPLDLIGPTKDAGGLAEDVLRNQGLPKESITLGEPELKAEPGAHFYHARVEAQLPDSMDPRRVMTALERALWREQIVLASEDASETEHSAVMQLDGFNIGEITLHHAAPRKVIAPEPVESHLEPAEPVAPAVVAAPPMEEHSAPPPATESVGEKVASAQPRVAIILDDGGYGGEATNIILQLDPKLTLSVLPNTPRCTALATEAREHGFEIMLHMPMENTSPTLVHPGQLDGTMDEAETRRLTEAALAQVPGAVGINNHEGSKFTSNAKALGRFMEGIKGSGLFFVDSRTTSESVAFEVARQFGIPTASCSLFLDNSDDPTAIRAQFQQLIGIAKSQGQAIGIAHFRESTAKTLREVLPTLAAEGVQLVHASELVK